MTSTHGLTSTLRMRTAISPGLAAMDSCPGDMAVRMRKVLHGQTVSWC